MKRAVHIVDDEEPIRRSLKLMLSLRGYAVTTYASGPLLLDALPGLAAGCLLLDVRMPDMDGLELQRELGMRGYDLPVMMMTGHGDVGVAIAALTHGAIALVEKPFSKEIIERALQLGFLKLEDAPAYRRHIDAAAASVGALEPGERAVLACLAAGRSNEATAEELGIPVASVEVRRARLLPQLGAESVNEALTIAFAAGFAPAGGGLRDIT